ncbi:MAG: hypothetical protein AAFX93_15790 [Verrucomicrobiota bacterium]
MNEITKIDKSILDEITAEQVEAWLAAKLHSTRETFPVSQIEISVSKLPNLSNYYASYTAHAPGACEVARGSFDGAINKVCEGFDPKRKSEEMRKQAQVLISKANELEAVSA